jgi:CubicO group peptidase (beta-lactamase class C family)
MAVTVISLGRMTTTATPTRSSAQTALDDAARAACGTTTPGVCVAVVHRDREPVISGAGVADVATGRPLTPETPSLWFSMTKIVTATAAVQLAERGVLSLDTPVRAVLPAFPEPRTSAPATVRHLLSHTAGLANPLPLRWVHPAREQGPDPEHFAAALLRKHGHLRGRPGDRAAYSNLGYIALGSVIARAAGQPFESYVRAEILDPLGMTRTGFRHDSAVATGHHPLLHPLTPVVRAVLPSGIVAGRSGRWLRFAPFEVDGAPYGGMIGPATDAARFLAMHVRDGEYGGVRILSASAARSMRDLTVHGRRLSVGLGWFRRRRDPASTEPYVEHLGGGAGYWNTMRVYPRRGVGVLTMGNATKHDHHGLARAALLAAD